MEREQRRLDNQYATPAARRARRLAARRHGFTLLEILVVIGIILLLVGIGVIGFRALDQSGRVTETTLKNLQAMLGEYEAMTALREQPPVVYHEESKKDPKKDNISLWQVEALTDAGGNGDVKGEKRYTWYTVANTQLALLMLNRVPANKQALTQLPSKQLHGTPSSGSPKGDKLLPAGDDDVINPPLVLDAWGNPIVFVGSDGLGGVSFSAMETKQRVTSAGLFEFRGPSDVTGLPRARRPFFASAGPDGDFRTGDDNVYSFDL